MTDLAEKEEPSLSGESEGLKTLRKIKDRKHCHMPKDNMPEDGPEGKRNVGSYNRTDTDRPRWDNNTTEIGRYDYETADGSPAYSIFRGINGRGEKVFITRRPSLIPYKERLEPEDKRDWHPNQGDQPDVLYRLPQLVAAIEATPGETVVVAEGEKDVDTARALGFIATCNPHGALKWKDEFAPFLRGCRVVIIPDNDDRGRQHAAKVLRSVEPVAQSVVVAELPGMPENGDLSDWTEARRANGEGDEALVKTLREIIAHAPDGKAWLSSGPAGVAPTRGAVANVDTVARIMEEHDKWQGLLAFDSFFEQLVLLKPVPGTTVPKSTFRPRPWGDDDLVNALRWLNRNGFPRAAKATVADAVEVVARHRVFSPVQDYLESLHWDGTERIGRWLECYCGADVTDDEIGPKGSKQLFVREAGRRWMISAVARALEPGCKTDAALVLEGPQGCGKSSALRILADGTMNATQRSWFSDSLQGFVGKDAASNLRGAWIIELSELAALKRSEVEHIKAFLTRQEDRYRPAYGRYEVQIKRRCVFAGTTNRDNYLQDETGNRRFWPIKVQAVELDWLMADRHQLWAEAVSEFRQGEPWHLIGAAEVYQRAAAAQREEDDPWSGVLEKIATIREVSTRYVLQLIGKMPSDHTKGDSHRVGGMLRRAGWERKGKFWSGEHQELGRYVNPDPKAGGKMGAEAPF